MLQFLNQHQFAHMLKGGNNRNFDRKSVVDQKIAIPKMLKNLNDFIITSKKSHILDNEYFVL